MAFKNPLSERIWQCKYCYYLDDEQCDKNIEETWIRLATAIAQVEEKEQNLWQKKFYSLLENFKFLPGGRIIAGAGIEKDVTLMNCFVMGKLEDSIDGIFEGLKEGAKTMQQGGGVGYDFSTLRPRGSIAEHAGTIASGPVSFMKVWDAMCATMLSTGIRRGAMMACLRCDHPDIEEFISAKAKQNELTHFNVSVLVTDQFLAAVKADESWQLKFPLNGKVYKTVKARELWQKIMSESFTYSEPGVLFIDRINRMNNLWYCEEISATNPCGEVPLPAYGACNLGSFNLTQFVRHPFSKQASFDFSEFEKCISIAVLFLDNVLDVTRFPLPKQKEKALSSRRLGLGITGLASAFSLMGFRYGDERSIELTGKILKALCWEAYNSRIELAREKGIFSDFNAEKFLQSGFAEFLPEDLRRRVSQFGLRNSHLIAVAPTGTISLLADNISSGIEPIFAFSYRRDVRLDVGSVESFQVRDYALQLYEQLHPGKELPNHFVSAQD